MKNIQHISNFISEQFPEFYKSEGPQFIQFVKSYYEWEESRSKVRKISELLDIDDTLDEYLKFFQSEYMSGIPNEILGDKRLLQKHILDLYRAKGSNEGLRLVFRLLFNEEIDIYVPSTDIFKLDDSTWYEPLYIEITNLPTNTKFEGKSISGQYSKATAIVERFERKAISGKIVDCLYVSNIKGNFEIDEYILYDGISLNERPKILGSPNSIEIISSTPGFEIGDQTYQTVGSDDGSEILGVVSSIENSSSGIIEFVLVDGGFGYNANSNITISSGANTTGNGAAFMLAEFSDIENLPISNIQINQYLTKNLNSTSFAYPGDTSSMATANLNSNISSSLNYVIHQYGKISKIIVTNPGKNYDGSITVNVNDPIFTKLKIPSSVGTYQGNNAVIIGNAIYGNGLAKSMRIKNSGFGYYDDNNFSTLKKNEFINSLVKINNGAVGKGTGYWINSNSFVDEDKYLQDDNYYQEYSYEIIMSKKLKEYSDILRKIVHPAGNKMFSKIKLITEG